ncbi:hypothetical protein Q1Z72_01520 [Pseudomonas qingdaonensis]|uniref:hypothetical protein n=1 Tax=Pseudomonas qingdaonensis TaxID=2056231 RepID=UPI0021190B8B|nr:MULTISPECIES: hypothetical protein [Pseudomonas]WKL67374.1 hypothetical protein Q1Z72_01520 [Pseudomonas qingdaonensis]
MQVTTSTIQIHALPNKPAIQLHEHDRELVGVYGVEVDAMDYPLHQSTAALNAFAANVVLTRPDDFSLHVFDPTKNVWLMTPAGEEVFPSDGEFTGMIDAPLLPIGSTLTNLRDEQDHDCEDALRLTPAGSRWSVLDIDRGSISIGCEESGATIFVSVCQLGTDFLIDKGFAEDAGLQSVELEEKYSPVGGGEHPMLTRLMWREAVANDDTISGYWAWVESEIAQAHWAK